MVAESQSGRAETSVERGEDFSASVSLPIVVEPARPLSRRGRAVWSGAGVACLGLATAGAYLPGLPATVFVLVAAYCFGRGNPERLAALKSHPTFGPLLARLRPGEFTWKMRASVVAAIIGMSGLSFLLLFPASHLTACIVAVAAAIGVIAVLVWP
jgi:uncharacterized membrane protein YbaN (DUF454 family)